MFSDPTASSSVNYAQPPRKSRKRHKPIARITSYDYNVQFDLRQKQSVRNGRGNKEGLFAAPIRTESYNVMEGETLMSIDKSNAYRDGQLHCFSFANGLGSMVPMQLKDKMVNGNTNEKRAASTLIRFIIMERLTYVGIAVTGFDASHDRYQDMTQGFVATFGGLNTIVNTGSKEIRPGDWISVGLPRDFKWEDSPNMRAKQQEGIPLDKLLFTLNPVGAHTDSEKIHEIIDAFNKLKSVMGSISEHQLPTALRDLKALDEGSRKKLCVYDGNKAIQSKRTLRAVISILHAQKRLVIGKALSFARVGEPFDIVLGGSDSM